MKKVTGLAAPLPQHNVDTDIIMPKRFLRTITREGLAEGVFADLRFNEDGTEKSEFVLNQPSWRGSTILVVGDNFGCGSSREHAPWAIADFGIKVILAESYADIFYSNCINNLILPIVLSPKTIQYAADIVTSHPSTKIEIDLESQIVFIGERSEVFSIEAHHKTNLLSGLDSIAQSLLLHQEIASHEAGIPSWLR